MRLQKYLADVGIASRRKSEELILEGKVSVNGKIIRELGVTVDPGKDKVAFRGKPVEIKEEKIYIAFNKPCGCITSCSDDKGRKTVFDYLKGIKERIYPIGRLDFTTEGLLLFTNDGELANKLMHPRNEINKRYLAIIDSDIDAKTIKELESGVFIEGGKTAPAKVKLLSSSKDRSEMTIIIHEGRNRQVRRMFEAVEKNVIFLKRISIGDINLGPLKKGEYRYLTQEEIEYLKKL